MTDRLDAVLQRMGELTQTIKDQNGDRSTIDMPQLTEQMEAMINARVAAELEKQKAAAPVRRIAGAPIEYEENDPATKANRYYRPMKDINRDGYHRIGGNRIKAVDFWLTERMLRGAHAIQPDRAKAPSNDLRAAVKALTSTGSGTGDELVPSDMQAQLWEDIFLASRIVNSMININPPTNPFTVPLGLGDVTWRGGTELTPTTHSDPATADSVLTAKELITEQRWSYTLNEDAIIAVMPAVRSRLAISGGEIVDAFALNADATNAATGNINLDDANPPDDSYYLSGGQDGLRHLANIDNTDQQIDAGGDALTDADIVNMLQAMLKYAVDPAQTRMITDVSTYLGSFLGLTNVVTIDKFGPKAVIHTGQLASYRGVPIIISASSPLTQADGRVSTTAANNTLGLVTAFNVNMWYVGFWRDLLIEIDRNIQTRAFIMVSSLRQGVAAHGTRSAATHTASIMNILV